MDWLALLHSNSPLQCWKQAWRIPNAHVSERWGGGIGRGGDCCRHLSKEAISFDFGMSGRSCWCVGGVLWPWHSQWQHTFVWLAGPCIWCVFRCAGYSFFLFPLSTTAILRTLPFLGSIDLRTHRCIHTHTQRLQSLYADWFCVCLYNWRVLWETNVEPMVVLWRLCP